MLNSHIWSFWKWNKLRFPCCSVVSVVARRCVLSFAELWSEKCIKNCCFNTIYNASFGSWAPVLIWPGMVPDRAKMILASHGVQRLSWNYFEPCSVSLFPQVYKWIPARGNHVIHYLASHQERSLIYSKSFYATETGDQRWHSGTLQRQAFTVPLLPPKIYMTIKYHAEYFWVGVGGRIFTTFAFTVHLHQY